MSQADSLVTEVGVMLTRKEMEGRRLAAAGFFAMGMSQAQVARKFDVSRTTASRWGRALQARGLQGLAAKKAPGRPRRLTREQFAKLQEFLLANDGVIKPRQYKLTERQVVNFIYAKFGVMYNPDHISKVRRQILPPLEPTIKPELVA